ncbi:MAG: DUF2723 domain-containing protein [Paludibacteraceae bacterium]|nr:DUF2723 domain-containing protein [Paludibacteraceae bacterium]
MKQFKLWNTVCGWVVFAIAAATYLMTMEPTASFWDCGEFISSAYKLDVGHPPGAPFFMLMGHFFSLFASDASHVAMCVNAMSALASAFCILFLFWTITALCKKLVEPNTIGKGIALLGAGAVGALAYTFSDTFWFSAVEGEVYASSSLFTAVVFWLILKWDEQADEEGSDRWLILIMYLMGLSIGVHLLNLLTIPAIAMVYYFRKYEFTWKGAITAFLLSCVILAVILYGIIPGFPTVAGWFELLFTNGFGCPFNTGLYVYLVLVAGLLGWGIWHTYKKLEENYTQKMRWIHNGLVMVTVILIGYFSYAVTVIRSNADTPMDQNSPDNVFALKSYLNREQYGDRPLLYGQCYNAPVKLEVKGNMCIPVEKKGHAQYAPAPKKEGEKDRYQLTGYKTDYVFMEEFCMLFPRMYSAQGSHVSAYKQWADVKGKRVKYDYCGQKKTDYCPTFAENMRFFFRYQVNFMYWRYFMWNFSGRQNDLLSYGDITKGNWLTGFKGFDNARLGNQELLPKELRENKGHNVYYMLPLLLGILGILWQLGKKNGGGKSFTVTFLLFFLTGLAIVLYLNQTPYQPRERDYAYAGSFYAFCIWIGMAVLGLYEWLTKKLKSEAGKAVVASVITIVCLLVPAQMASQNWDDHDRSDRYTCRDFGANYLKSCEEDAIIFSNGDNDTFPLWYNQEVEGEGADMRVCNLSYLQTDWYISQMKRPYYGSSALPINWEYKDFMPGTNEVVRTENRIGQPISVEQAFEFVRSDDPRTKMDGENYIPTNQLYIDNPSGEPMPVKPARRYTRSEMMVLEMVQNIAKTGWERPIYFAVTVGNDYYLGLEPYFENCGMAYRITPTRSADGQERVNTAVMYDNMMHKFRFGNINKPGIYVDENLMRMCRTHRMMFAQLAEALVREGKREQALEVLDYADEMLPGYNVPYETTSVSMGALYYYLEQPEKANRLMTAVADNCIEYLEWGKTLNRDQRKAMESTLGQQAAILDYVCRNMRSYGQTDLANEYMAKMNNNGY